MPLEAREALDRIDRFIQVASSIARLPLLQKAEYRPAAEDLYLIAQKLLVSNENMARWLNLFLQFDFRQADARGQFMNLAGSYATAKSGQAFHDMKFNCGDSGMIYYRNIDAKVPQMYAEDRKAADAARVAFADLSNADNDMVAFIYDTVVSGIDGLVDRTEAHLENSDVNAAEAERLRFKVDTRDLSARLIRFANELSDLVLTFAGLARRPVTLP